MMLILFLIGGHAVIFYGVRRTYPSTRFTTLFYFINVAWLAINSGIP
jgi:hypothetical protein